MKGKLLINNTVFSVDISDQDWQEFLASQKKKQTGYESVRGGTYYYHAGFEIMSFLDNGGRTDDLLYDIANYYCSREVAENNARADELMRRLRRFAAEHRSADLDWSTGQSKHCIYYNHADSSLRSTINQRHHVQGAIYFDTLEAADAAIEEFRDELIWYFTEYKDSL